MLALTPIRFYIGPMKGLLSVILTGLGMAALADGLTSVQINGNSYSNISKAYAASNGKIIIIFPDGGTSANADSVPADFLKSWGINADGAKSAAVISAQNNLKQAIQAGRHNLEQAIETGRFREIHGIIYDTRRAESGWVAFSNVKVIQIFDGNAIVDCTPEDYYSSLPIFVKNISPSVGDTDYITFVGKPDGSYSYENKAGDQRTIRSYDLGHVCERSEIPESVLSGKRAYDFAGSDGTPQIDVVAKLPDGKNLTASGSGFFVSADGFLVTNNHVVKGANRIKVKTAEGVFPAQVIRTDPTNDLALVKVSGHFKPLQISTNDVQLGDPVFTIGFPDIDLQGTQPKYTDGKISSLTGIKDDPSDYQISVPVQPGNSGGPLVDTSGNVCGIIVARLNDFAALESMGGLPQNVNYAIKGKLLRDFLGQGIEVRPSAPAAAPTGNLVAAVQQSVAIVLVY
jgi:S1-C subfamily serine protease